MKRAVRWLIAGVLGAAALAVAALAAALFLLQTEAGARYAGQRLSAALGREVQVGSTAVGGGWPPMVVARDVRVANADWADEPFMAVLPEVTLSADVFALVAGRLVLDHLQFSRPRVLLQRSADGTGNWSFLTDEDADGRLPIVRAFLLQHGELLLRDVAGPAEIQSAIQQARGSILGPGREVRLEVRGALEQAPFRANLHRPPDAPGFQADVNLEYLDLRPFFAGDDARHSDRVLPTATLRLGPLRTLRGTARLTSETLRLPGVAFDELQGHLILHPDSVTVRDLRFGVAGGRLHLVELAMTPVDDSLDSRIDLHVEQLSLRRLLAELGLEVEGFGNLQGRLQLTGRGASLAEILGGADGRVDLTLRRGRLDRMLMALASQNLGDILGALGAGEGDTLPLRCAIAAFRVTGGVMQARTLILDAERTKILGSGRVDLGEEKVDLVFLPRNKDFTLMSARAPMRVSGDFRDVSVRVDGGEAVASLLTPVDLGVGEDAPCDELVAAVRGR